MTSPSPIKPMRADANTCPQFGHRRTAEQPLNVSGMSSTSPSASTKAKSGASKTYPGKIETLVPSRP